MRDWTRSHPNDLDYFSTSHDKPSIGKQGILSYLDKGNTNNFLTGSLDYLNRGEGWYIRTLGNV